jgi:hypothetical protein
VRAAPHQRVTLDRFDGDAVTSLDAHDIDRPLTSAATF